jgi:aerobic-type carbon monoxide dehydrogenase small subunit (CoxS/CutS family)
VTERQRVVLNVNGEIFDVEVEPRRTLVDVLRHDIGLTGTHVGCEHGICGACTVLVDGAPMRSCLAFGVQLEGHAIETVESLAEGGELGDLQASFAHHEALQCGFCTPGFLMLGEGYLRGAPSGDSDEVRTLVSSNLCRCTGYQGIVEAIQAAVASRVEDA